MNTFLQDIRYGFRMLFKNPGFTAVALLTLALGIGANTAIFSVINGVLLRPLLYKNVERIVTIWQNNEKEGIDKEEVPPATFIDWKEHSRSFEEIAAASRFGFDLSSGGEPERLRAFLVTDGFFEILGTNPLYGRTLRSEDYKPGEHHVVVLSQSLWAQRFGSNPNIIGQSILLDDEPYTIVGVMPSAFQFPESREVWAPKIFSEEERTWRGVNILVVIARLKSGITTQQAQSEMDTISSRLSQEYQKTNAHAGVTVTPLREEIVGEVRPALFVLFVAVGFVLLIGCANVANLLLTRGVERKKELAIRAAMGATRWQLVRLILVENLLLALLGGMGGVVFAGWILDILLQLSPVNLPRIDQIGMDGAVLLFVLAISFATAILFGLLPSLQISRTDLHDTLKAAGSTVSPNLSRHILRNVLIVSEVAMSLILLVGAGLLARSFADLLKVNLGFSADKVVALQVFAWDRHPTPEKRASYFKESLQRLSSMPGVEAAGAVSALPLLQFDMDTSFRIEGRPPFAKGEEPSAYYTVATPDYFKAMSIPLMNGRFFNDMDRGETNGIALISERLSRRFFPEENPIGKKLVLNFNEPFAVEIVGVVGDTRHNGLDSDLRSEIYVPHLQDPFGSMAFVVRTSSNPMSMLSAIKQQIWVVDKYQTFAKVVSMNQLVSDSLGGRRFNLALMGSFAISALALASIGIYGLLSFSITQRTKEIGIRLALGARANEILRMVLWEGMLLVGGGIGLGILGALALTRFLQSLLFRVSPTDPIIFIVVSLILGVVAFCASYIPARRASKFDPMIALRYE